MCATDKKLVPAEKTMHWENGRCTPLKAAKARMPKADFIYPALALGVAKLTELSQKQTSSDASLCHLSVETSLLIKVS
jgi:hypothetical protein